MTKEMTDDIERQTALDWQPRQPVTAGKWRDLLAQQHTAYSRHGERCTGVVWDPAWEGRDISEVFCPDNPNHRCTTDWNAALALHRASIGERDQGVYRITVQIYGRNVDAEVDIVDEEAGTRLNENIIISDAGFAWGETTFEVDAGDIFGGTDNLRSMWLLTIEVSGLDPAFTFILQADYSVSYLEPAELPTDVDQWG